MTHDLERKAVLLEGIELKEDGGEDTGTFTGYGSVFGTVDRQGDVVEPGAFARSLREGKGIVPLLWMHDPGQPIGQLECEEDDRGLKVRGRIALDVTRGREVYSLLKAGFLRGLSIGYRTVKEKLERGARRLLDIDLWEVSLVTFPANPRALVGSVKSVEAREEAPEREATEAAPARPSFAWAEGEAAAERAALAEAKAAWSWIDSLLATKDLSGPAPEGWEWLESAEAEIRLHAKARAFLDWCLEDLGLTERYAPRIEWVAPASAPGYLGEVGGTAWLPELPWSANLDVIRIRKGQSDVETLRTVGHEVRHIQQMLSGRLPRLAPQCTEAQRWAAEREAEAYELEALARFSRRLALRDGEREGACKGSSH